MTSSNSSLIHLAIRSLEDTLVYKIELLKDELREVKNQMADLNQSVEDLKVAVQGVSDRVNQLVGPLQEQIATLESSLAAEREAAANLAASEDAEDVAQNQALADAQAATDTALANAQTSADNIQSEVSKLNAVAAGEPGEL